MILLTLTGKLHLGGNICTYRFEPSSQINWLAGQFIRIELPHGSPDAGGTKRQFTISSAPHERFVQITTRISTSSFKQALSQMEIGEAARLLDLPAGSFVWPQNTRLYPVFIAQGIGITPFYSMLKHRLHSNQRIDATLIYANLTTPTPFEAELENWARNHPEFKLIFKQEPIKPAHVAGAVSDLLQSVVYVSGPKPLVGLLTAPFNLPASQLKHDVFPNYPAASY